MSIDCFDLNVVIERYVDDIVGSFDFLEVKEKLKEYLIREKYQLSNDELELEIMRSNPHLFTDLYVDEILEEVSNG
jgi:hypothetical protein